MEKEDTLIHRIQTKDFANLKTDMMSIVNAKVREKIDAKKEEVTQLINNKCS